VPLENLERAERERIILFSEFSPSMPTSLLALLVTLGSILRSRLDLFLRENRQILGNAVVERQDGQI
jgi:hypothetical protein